MGSFDYDLITIGAGSGGVRASRMASQAGAKVAIIENTRTGGTCVMRGCVPKKLLVYGSHFSQHFEDAIGFGWALGPQKFNWAALIEAKNKELQRLEDVYHKILTSSGVTELFGTGRILTPHTVQVGEKILSTKYILIATGGWPSLPKVPGIEYAITSNEALDLQQLPKSVAIVGGGFIGVEFAGIFKSLKSEVHQIIRAPKILRGFDHSLRDSLSAEMEKRGIKIHYEVNISCIEKLKNNTLRLELKSNEELLVDTIMFATGREPNTKGLGLTQANVKREEKGAIIVDKYSKTSIDNIYAIGDVTNRMNLTPVALAEAMALVKTLFNKTPTSLDYKNIPSAVFSQPPIATVGLTENEARQNEPIDVYVSSFKPMKHSLSKREELSVMKLIVSQETNRVLGCHMMGEDAPEIIQGIAIAIHCGATKEQFDGTIGIHPTSAEEFVTMREKFH